MSELKLLPCPFCGAEAEAISCGMTGVYRARCKDCSGEISTGIEGGADVLWNTRSPPELPPVSPEDLVEGEWYVFNYHTAFIPMIGKAEIHQGKFRLVDSFHSSKWSWANSETTIYGPLRFKIGGAE